MIELLHVERKGDVLTRPSLPCLARYHTINLTAGCQYECRYCYAQSFHSYPGRGRVKFYANTLESLAKQLPRKRKLPEMVFFSTACEPFMPLPEILDCLYGCMALLLEAGCKLLITTKAEIPQRFIDLFRSFPSQPHVQVGLTTVDDSIRALMEPNASTVDERLDTLEKLHSATVSCEIRIDPLIPGLTDTADRFDLTMRQASLRGVTHGIMSYLFLRRGNMTRLSSHYGDWHFGKTAASIFTQKIENYANSTNTIRVPSTEYRQRKYKELQTIGTAHGIHLGLCACKNPDITTACCHPLPQPANRPPPPTSGNLFAQNNP